LTIGSVPGQRGGSNLALTGVAGGTYTVLLSDGENVPTAVFETTDLLGDGFTASNGTMTATPAPTTFELAGLAGLAMALARRRTQQS